jgi:exosortase E/protease (VPEID-CTERM system)
VSQSIDPVADEFIHYPHPYVRPVALLLLLLAEAFLFTMRFDAPTFVGEGSWWASLIHQSRFIQRMLVMAPFAIGAFGGLRLAVRVRRALELQVDDHDRWTSWLLAHGLALAGFAWLTRFICEGSLAASSHPGAWTLAWVGSGLAVGSTWAATLLPPTTWVAILRRNRGAVALGASVAAGALLLGNYSSHLWDSMAGVTLALVRAMLGLASRNVACDPASRTVSVDGFGVAIAPACSGFEGIGLVVAFLSAYAWWFRDSLRWPRSYLLLPLGAAVIYLSNAVRIAALLLIGAWASPEVALGAFHSQAGWIAFLGVSLGLVAASRRSSFFAVEVRDVGGPVGSNPSASFLGPFLVVLATSMITGAFSSGFGAFYGLRVLTGGFALWYFRRDFAGSLRGCSWAGIAIGVIAFGLWVALEPASTGASRSLASTVGTLPRGLAWAWVALRVIGSVAIVPLAEELAFRGYLTRRLISVDFESVPLGRLTWTSLMISSAAFGLLHGRWLAGLLVGILYALAMSRRGKLGDAILAHAVTNLLIAGTVLATGDWAMWS